MTKLAIIGSRDFDDYALLKAKLTSISPAQIISGGAKGADKLAERYAIEQGIDLIVYKADWKQYGRGAGIIRNRQIIEHCDEVLAFWDGQSRGTKSSIDYARKLNKPIVIELFQKGH